MKQGKVAEKRQPTPSWAKHIILLLDQQNAKLKEVVDNGNVITETANKIAEESNQIAKKTNFATYINASIAVVALVIAVNTTVQSNKQFQKNLEMQSKITLLETVLDNQKGGLKSVNDAIYALPDPVQMCNLYFSKTQKVGGVFSENNADYMFEFIEKFLTGLESSREEVSELSMLSILIPKENFNFYYNNPDELYTFDLRHKTLKIYSQLYKNEMLEDGEDKWRAWFKKKVTGELNEQDYFKKDKELIWLVSPFMTAIEFDLYLRKVRASLLNVREMVLDHDEIVDSAMNDAVSDRQAYYDTHLKGWDDSSVDKVFCLRALRDAYDDFVHYHKIKG
jgi:hypothetical protein